MAVFNFQKPDKVIMIDSTDFEGKFEFRPLESGYGWILGYALRHVLLSSFEGYVITSVRIEDVEHMFSTISGVVEDVTEIILNLKQVRLKRKIEDVDKEFVVISFSGKDKLVAGDLDKYMSGFQVLNPDFVICNLDSRTTINMKLKIEKGLSYVSYDENRKQKKVIGTFLTDSIYKPIKNVKYAIENLCLGNSDFEKLVLEIITDGSIRPQDALAAAAKTLIHHFMLFSDHKIAIEADDIVKDETCDEDLFHMKQLLKTKLEEMSLSARVLNCLKIIQVETLGDLVSFKKTDLIKIRNLGKKSLAELDELVAGKGLNFGMELTE